jgi:hypothetical protein
LALPEALSKFGWRAPEIFPTATAATNRPETPIAPASTQVFTATPHPPTAQPSPTPPPTPVPTPTPLDIRRRILSDKVINQVSSVRIQNGCVKLYGHRDSDQLSQSLCAGETPNLAEEWNDRAKQIEIDCSTHPNIIVELFTDADFRGGVETYTCGQP